MRQLTSKQKKILDKFIADNTNAKNSIERYSSVFSNGRHLLNEEDLPAELYAEIEKINDTEILWQEINRYMTDKCSEIIYKS
jgi:hypothetical protein